MGRKTNSYLIIGAVTIVLLMVLQYNQPKELNWFPSYVTQHKIPYGTFVLNELMSELFPEIEQIYTTPFDYLNDHFETEGTYFMVNDDIAFEKAELETLLDWTAEGNTLFVASGSFEERLLDTLNLGTSGLFADFGQEHSQFHQLVNPRLQPETSYPFSKDAYSTIFNKIDTLQTTVIGVVDHHKDSLAAAKKHFNVIRQTFGRGEIILSTFPKAFTNYFILKDDNRNYTAGLLSYIDASRPVLIDNHYKSGKKFYSSPMYIFLNTKEFKWAYYLILIAALLYVLFEGKRKQRAIPVVLPLKNQTLAFTRTIADMYYERNQRMPIVSYKIEQFLEYIRMHLHMDTVEREDEFYRNLAARSAHTYDEIKNLFTFLERIKGQHDITDTDLEKLNSTIEQFKHKANGK